MGKFIVGGVIGLIAIVAIGFMWGVGVNNKEIRLRNLSTAQMSVIEANYDKMWKVIQQQAGVADEAKNAFKEIYIPLIEGRYSNDSGTMMKWITEQNPQFNTNLYEKLMTSIEALRADFFQEQKKMISIVNEHNNLRMMFPSSLIVGGASPIEYTVISSKKTKAVMESGEENDIDVFKKDK